jgi:hypothetical protein
MVHLEGASAHTWQQWYKPVASDATRATAVLVMNHDAATQPALPVTFHDVPSFKDLPRNTQFTVRDLHHHKDLGTFQESFTTPDIVSHDSVFLMIRAVVV